MSPEQLRGDPATQTWDLWALAIVAYEMLAGDYPFKGATTPEWHAAVMGGLFTPLSRRLPSAPPQWDHLFARALAMDPAQRPRAASEFLSNLERSLA